MNDFGPRAYGAIGAISVTSWMQGRRSAIQATANREFRFPATGAPNALITWVGNMCLLRMLSDGCMPSLLALRLRDQRENSSGIGAPTSRSRVTPPRIISRRRECP